MKPTHKKTIESIQNDPPPNTTTHAHTHTHTHAGLLPDSPLPPQIIAAQEEMLRKERELVEARKKLAMIRQQQYKFLPSELREDTQEQ